MESLVILKPALFFLRKSCCSQWKLVQNRLEGLAGQDDLSDPLRLPTIAFSLASFFLHQWLVVGFSNCKSEQDADGANDGQHQKRGEVAENGPANHEIAYQPRERPSQRAKSAGEGVGKEEGTEEPVQAQQAGPGRGIGVDVATRVLLRK